MTKKELITSVLLVINLIHKGVICDKSSLMNFFKNIEGKNILSGSFGGFTTGPYKNIYNENFFSLAEAEGIHNLTNKYPAMYTLDCGFPYVTEPGKEANLVNCFHEDLLGYAKSGGIIGFSLLLPNPILPGNIAPNNQTHAYDYKITNEEYRRLITKGTPERARLFRFYDKIAEGLSVYDSEDIAILYRPYQEMNCIVFWWENLEYEKKDEERIEMFKTLWREHHDYMTNEKGLKNVIWVYAPFTWNSFKTEYYPGDDYVDIVALDAYMNDFNFLVGYDEMLKFGKPFALAEVGPQHDATMKKLIYGKLDYNEMVNVINKRYPKVVYFTAWNDMWSPIRNLNAYGAFNNPRVLNLGDFIIE